MLTMANSFRQLASSKPMTSYDEMAMSGSATTKGARVLFINAPCKNCCEEMRASFSSSETEKGEKF